MMAEPTQPIVGARRGQMFPTLEPTEIERLRRFGEARSYVAGEALARVGEPGHGLTLILSGQVDVTQNAERGRRELIVSHGPGSFMGELAQLSGRPMLVDARATTPVEAIVIPSHRLPVVLVSAAEV